MSELLDLKLQDEFSFRMSSLAERGQKEELQTDCGRVVDLAKATVKDMCLLAVQLYEMREKEHWQHVINPKTGFGFYNDTFADFCEYAFGFSKTKTSDLLRISQFVSLHGDNRGEIEAGYQSYNTSQLIELASVPPSNRAYFNSDMSVAEMRVAKDYVKNSAEFIEEKKKVGFDLLTKAQEWKSSAKKSEPVKPDVMDGQMSLFSEENEETDDDGAGLRNPTSDLAELGEEIEQEYIPERDEYEPGEDEVWQGGGVDHDADEYDEADEVQEDMHAEMETIEADAEKSVAEKSDVGFGESPQKRYKFTTRDEIRFFLSDYRNWYYRDDLRTPFTKVGYWCTLKNFDIINVLEANTISNRSLLSEAEEIEEKGPIFFLYRAKYKDQPSVMIGKVQLEVYLMAIRDRL